MTCPIAGQVPDQPSKTILQSTITCPNCGHRSRETMMALAINAILSFGILAATLGMIAMIDHCQLIY